MIENLKKLNLEKMYSYLNESSLEDLKKIYEEIYPDTKKSEFNFDIMIQRKATNHSLSGRQLITGDIINYFFEE